MLDGTWIPVAAELGGQLLSADILKTMRLFLIGNKYVAKVGLVTDQGLVRVDLKKKPNAMDIIGTGGPNEGRTIQAIYELNDDELTVCYALDGNARPVEFKTRADSQHYLVMYKRAYP